MRIGKYKFRVIELSTGQCKGNYDDLSDARYRLKDLRKTYPDNKYDLFNQITKEYEE
jgi:hypothetical protein